MKNRTSSLCMAMCLGLTLTAGVIGFTGCAGDRYNRSTGEYIDDKALTTRVSSALSDNAEYKFGDVVVNVFRGTVQLSGFVNTSDQKSRAAEVARSVNGVRDVVNNITIKDRVNP
jgi:hyperosmotically inducible periplasmic protein